MIWAETASLEKLQAAFILKFTNYIEWPYQPKETPFTIAVLKDQAMYDALSESFAGKSIAERVVKVEKVEKFDKDSSYQIIFIKNQGQEGVKRLHNVKSSGLLSISVDPSGIQQDVVVNFYLADQDKLRFEINNEEANARELKINSRLLNLAKSSK